MHRRISLSNSAVGAELDVHEICRSANTCTQSRSQCATRSDSPGKQNRDRITQPSPSHLVSTLPQRLSTSLASLEVTAKRSVSDAFPRNAALFARAARRRAAHPPPFPQCRHPVPSGKYGDSCVCGGELRYVDVPPPFLLASHSPAPVAAQIAEEAFLARGLDRADWRKRKYIRPSSDEAHDNYESSLFDEGQVRGRRSQRHIPRSPQRHLPHTPRHLYPTGVLLPSLSERPVCAGHRCVACLLPCSTGRPRCLSHRRRPTPCSTGMALYFRLLLYLVGFFTLASLAALPAILLNAGGQRFTDEDVDGLGLARLTLGNLGPPPATALDFNSTADADAFTVSLPFFGTQYTLAEAADVLTYADLAYSLLFIAFCVWWVRKLEATERSVDDENVTAADYAVFVRGLPKDATVADVRAHFDRLYNLRKVDWTYNAGCCCCCLSKTTQRRQFHGPRAAARLEKQYAEAMRALGRRRDGPGCLCCPGQRGRVAPSGRPLPRSRVDWRDWFVSPVLNATNTNNPAYLKSWVAEVTLAYPNGGLIRRYRALQAMRTRLLHARAVIKVYTDPRGWQPSQAGCCGVEVETDCSCSTGWGRCCIVRSGSLASRLAAAETHLKRIEERLRSLDLRHAAQLSSDVTGAFVIFNNEESYRRCLYDYQHSDAWYNDLCGLGCNRCCQPPPLRFKEKRPLVVTPASEPSDVIWENLQTPQWERALRVTCTNTAMLLFLVASFVAIVLSQRQQEAFSNTLPTVAVCQADAPAIAFRGRGSIPDPLPSLQRTRGLDAACSTAMNVSGQDFVHLWYTDTPAPAPGADLQDTTLDSQGNAEESVVNLCRGPCVPRSVTDNTPCVAPPKSGQPGPTTTFPVRNLIGCFCQQTLQAAIAADGIFSGAASTLENHPECEQLASSFVLAQTLLVISAGGIVIINTGLHGFLAMVTRLEHHDSVSHLKNATAIKLFFALFLNTGLLVLLVHARVQGAREALPGVPLFTGTFTSFTSAWYASAGVSVALTMLINIAAPHALPLAKYLCLYPCRRRCCTGHALVQSELNELYAAPEFEIESRVPHVMNTVVVTLLYCSGIPILLPFAALALLVTFAIDKLLLLRFYARPPLLDAAMARLAANIMPFAILVHCGFAVWFYGDEEAVASTPVLLGDPGGVGAEQRYQDLVARASSWDAIGFAPRVSRQNTFPMFFLFLLLAIGLVLRFTAGRLVLAILGRALFLLSGGRLCSGRDEVHENFNPPFTAEFERKIPVGVKTALSPEDQELGWRIVDDHMRAVGAQAQVKVWGQSGSQFGKVHYKGDFMLTWEVVAEYGIASYDMAANPRYAQAVLALERGAAHAATTVARAAVAQLRSSAAKVGTAASAISAMAAAAEEGKARRGGVGGSSASPQRLVGAHPRSLRPSGASASLVHSGSQSARGGAGGGVAPPSRSTRPGVSPGRVGPLPPLQGSPAPPPAQSPPWSGRSSFGTGLPRPGSFTAPRRTGAASLQNTPGLTQADDA